MKQLDHIRFSFSLYQFDLLGKIMHFIPHLGTCVGPNTCECNHGFTLNREQNNVCEPVCSKECKFGTCVAPEQCECLDGYSKNSTNECHPICDFCENGHCVSPNRCECHGDFKTIVQEKG